MSSGKERAGFAVAVCADLIQVGLPFLFSEGFLSPFNDFLDVSVCAALTLLIGWHIAFIPSFLVEILPVANLAPTWTVAFFIATRSRQASVAEQAPSDSQPVAYDEKGWPLHPVKIDGHERVGAKQNNSKGRADNCDNDEKTQV